MVGNIMGKEQNADNQHFFPFSIMFTKARHLRVDKIVDCVQEDNFSISFQILRTESVYYVTPITEGIF